MSVAIKTPAPIKKTVRVRVSAQRAFDVFTAKMTKWWLAEHTLLKAPRETVVVEARTGGRWYEVGIDGTECEWGHVVAWEPPGRVVLAWQIDASWAFNPRLVTEIEVRFIPDGPDATRIELEHRHLERMGEAAEAVRASLDGEQGWGAELASYVAATSQD